MLPPQSYDRVNIFGGLFLVLLLCTPVWFIALEDADPVDDQEAATLLASRETWQLQSKDTAGNVSAWAVVPTYHGEARFDPPPLAPWLQILAWSDLKPDSATPEQLIHRARLLSLLMGYITLLATYWAGMSIGDARVARFATIALATTLLFVHQTRIASVDTHMLAWSTLAIAAGLWAMRPLKEVNWVGRRIIGWLIGGLAMGAAILTAGAQPAALYVLPPLFAAIVLTPRRRIDNLLGLTFACILGVVAASPWYLYVLQHHPESQASLFGSLLPPSELFVLTVEHWKLLLVLSPWSVWLIGALFQPFLRADRDRRRQLLIVWFWFLLLFVVLSIPAAGSPRYLAPLLPAAALLVGQLWAYHAQLASERQIDPGVDILRIPHWVVLCAASILGPLILLYQQSLIARGYLNKPLLAEMNATVLVSLATVLFLIAAMGMRWHFKWKPRLAAYATAAWMIAACAACIPAYERSHQRAYPHRADADNMALVLSDRPVARLDAAPASTRDDAFFFYLGRTIPPLSPEQLESALRANPRLAVLTSSTDAHDAALRAQGWVPIMDFDHKGGAFRLYTAP